MLTFLIVALTTLCTKAVVAICVVLVATFVAVGALGVPVNVGDAFFAYADKL